MVRVSRIGIDRHIGRYLRFLRVSADFFSGIGRFIYLLNFFGHDLQLHRYIDVID